MRCPNCGTELPNDAIACMQCGYEIPLDAADNMSSSPAPYNPYSQTPSQAETNSYSPYQGGGNTYSPYQSSESTYSPYQSSESTYSPYQSSESTYSSYPPYQGGDSSSPYGTYNPNPVGGSQAPYTPSYTPRKKLSPAVQVVIFLLALLVIGATIHNSGLFVSHIPNGTYVADYTEDGQSVDMIIKISGKKMNFSMATQMYGADFNLDVFDAKYNMQFLGMGGKFQGKITKFGELISAYGGSNIFGGKKYLKGKYDPKKKTITMYSDDGEDLVFKKK